MSYIVWDNNESRIFKTAKEAWGYITPILKDNPVLKFQGFGQTVTNINNRVAVLRDFETKKPWLDFPSYLQPQENSDE